MSKIKDIELEIDNLLSSDKDANIDKLISSMEAEVNNSLNPHILLSIDSLEKYLKKESKKPIYSDGRILLQRTTNLLCEVSINFIKQRRDNYWSKVSNKLNKQIEKSILEKFNYLEECFEKYGILVDNIHSLEKIAEANPKFTSIEEVEDLAKDFTPQNIEEEKLKTIVSKIATLQMTGVLDSLYENENFKKSDNKLAEFLCKLLGGKKVSIQPILSAIKSFKNDPNHHSKNNPFKHKEATLKLEDLLVSFGIDPVTLKKNTPKKS